MSATPQEVLTLIAQEDYLKAQKKLKELIAQSPDQEELYRLYGYCVKRIDDICEEIDKEPKPRQAPKPLAQWEQWRQEAATLADKGEYKKAATLLGLVWDGPDIIQRNPYLPLCFSLQPRSILLQDRALCQFLLGKTEEAKELYTRAINIELNLFHADDPGRIDFLLKLKNYDETFRLFDLDLSHRSFEDRCEVYYKRYKVHKKLGNDDAAAQDLQNAFASLDARISTQPFFYLRYYMRASWLIEKGDFQNALLDNAKAIALWPELYQYHLQRAEIYARLGQTQKAQQKLVLVEQGTLSRGHECRPAEKARIYELLGNMDKAEELYRSENIRILTRYEQLYAFYERHNRQDDIVKLRQIQRQESHFHNRVCEQEILDLF